jgi:hypothetical protein
MATDYERALHFAATIAVIRESAGLPPENIAMDEGPRYSREVAQQIAALTAERDRYMAEASERQREIGRLDSLMFETTSIIQRQNAERNDLVAERDALMRWQGEAVPSLNRRRMDVLNACLSNEPHECSEHGPELDQIQRLIAEAEGTGA